MTEINIARRLSGVDTDGKIIELHQNDLLGRTEPIVILGDAGMGKTTLLEEIGGRGVWPKNTNIIKYNKVIYLSD